MDNESLVLDFAEWVRAGPRSYVEVMAAWRTSCPRLTIWEDAVDAGLVCVEGQRVIVSARGACFLQRHGRLAVEQDAG